MSKQLVRKLGCAGNFPVIHLWRGWQGLCMGREEQTWGRIKGIFKPASYCLQSGSFRQVLTLGSQVAAIAGEKSRARAILYNSRMTQGGCRENPKKNIFFPKTIRSCGVDRFYLFCFVLLHVLIKPFPKKKTPAVSLKAQPERHHVVEPFWTDKVLCVCRLRENLKRRKLVTKFSLRKLGDWLAFLNHHVPRRRDNDS